ncbi:MAG: hypothetical protein ABIE42_02980 [Candidatus Eisenbacteria bacterium]
MKECAYLLAVAMILTGCEGTDLVGIDSADPGRPSLRPQEATMIPMCSSLYRIGGTHDPDSPDYNPSVADTALMHVPHTFAWSGRDPDGLCDPLLFRHRLDGDAFSEWAPDTTSTIDGLADGGHDLVVQPGCPGAPGIEDQFGFVVNFDPDSEIVEPPEESGTPTIRDGDTLWVRVVAWDREELEGVGGGIAQVVVEMGEDVLTFVPPDAAEWWWSSNADPASGHYIESRNSPQGGNALHLIRVNALDVDGRWEENGESYMFWYNFPPTVIITFPSESDTPGSDFTVLLEGSDPDGEVALFQYVLDPAYNTYETTESSEISFEDVAPGPHEFRVRAQDASGCWSTTWSIVSFTSNDR